VLAPQKCVPFPAGQFLISISQEEFPLDQTVQSFRHCLKMSNLFLLFFQFYCNINIFKKYSISFPVFTDLSMDVQLIMKRIGAVGVDGNEDSLVGEEEEGSQNAAGG
jgi:hypothetical protein